MPLARPPRAYDGAPSRYVLRGGTRLWRVHSRNYQAWSFNPVRADVLYGGARFDSTAADPYPYLYVALAGTTAVAETMLRDLEPDDRGWRMVPREKAAGARLSALALTRDLTLVSLVTGEDLAAIGQDAWLVTAPGREYPQTRDWCHWLRRAAPWAHGLAWDSFRDRGNTVVVLFGDRLAADFGPGCEKVLLRELPELAVDFDDGGAGSEWLNECLRRYRAVVGPAASVTCPA